jgi:ABC-type bacteriocin/lantibiotic exporter with double-glycine peptidase domain
MALSLLLKLEGREQSLERLLELLPTRSPAGFSMAELAAASRKLGLALDGVEAPRGRSTLERPAIVLFQGPRGGHYAVVRPVGSTQTMVQVIDPPGHPFITDYNRLTEGKMWTGRALIPSKPYWPRWAVAGCLAVAGTLLIALELSGLTRRKYSNSRAVASG